MNLSPTMKLRFLPLLLAALLAVACKSNPQSVADGKKNSSTTATKPNDNAAAEADEDLYLDLEKDGRYVGSFAAATVYAGAIDFDFTIGKRTKLIRVSASDYYALEKGKKIPDFDIPSNFIDPAKDLEGPPGGNPALIGKTYEITVKGGKITVKAM